MTVEMPEVDGVSHRWVEARGLKFHVAEAGEGDDVVLCLHGWPQNWYEWRHLMPALAADGHRVLAMDLRGYGWSDAPSDGDGYLKENMADDVLAVLDELGLRRVKLVAHDWGGWIGFLLGMKAPERFDRYLALNILHPWIRRTAMLPHLWRFWYQWVILTPGLGYRLHRDGRFVRKVIVGASTQKDVWDERTLSVFADKLAEPDHAMAGVQTYRVFNLKETRPIFRGKYADKRLSVPTRLVFGEDDFALRPSLLAGYEEHADDLEVELVPDCGHFIADERPDLVAERAREFLSASVPA
jgi:pimeloyl-ACP methyl ester carboxylesterase